MQLPKLSSYVKKTESIFDTVENLKDNLNKKKGGLETIEKELNWSQEKLLSFEEQSKIILKAQNLLNGISNELRSNSLEAIEGIVTSAIKEVFTDKDVAFKMEMNLETAKPSLNVFIKEDGYEFSILDSRGLGMADLIATALRVCIKSMYKPKISFPIILDESFKFLHGMNVNGSYPSNAFKFLKKITSGLDEQVIFVTGAESKDFVQVADKLLVIKQEDGVSTIIDNE